MNSKTVVLTSEEVKRIAEKALQNEREQREFEKNLHSLLKGDKKIASKPLTIGTTANALAVCGARKGIPITISKRIIDKAMRPEIRDENGMRTKKSGHFLSENQVVEALDNLKEPVLVLRGSRLDSIVAVTEIKDEKSQQIIVPIELNKVGDTGIVNNITSIYGREQFEEYIKNNIRDNNLLAVNTEKANEENEVMANDVMEQTHEAKKTLFSVEQNGFISYYDMGVMSLEELRQNFMESEHPFNGLGGKKLSEADFAWLEQSDKVSFSVMADIDNDKIQIYEINGIPEEERTGENTRIGEMEISEYVLQKQTVETNIGSIPIEDYREIVAQQNGFDSYENMYKAGYRLGNNLDKASDNFFESENVEELLKRTTETLSNTAQDYYISGHEVSAEFQKMQNDKPSYDYINIFEIYSRGEVKERIELEVIAGAIPTSDIEKIDQLQNEYSALYGKDACFVLKDKNGEIYFETSGNEMSSERWSETVCNQIDLYDDKKGSSMRQEESGVIEEFTNMLNQQDMKEQSQEFTELIQYAAGMQAQFAVMAEELKAVRGQLEELQKYHPKSVTEGFIDKVSRLHEKVINLSKQLSEVEKHIVKTAAQAVSTFKEKGKEEMFKVVRKGISSVKAVFENYRKGMADVMADYEKTAKQIDDIGDELKQIGNSVSNVGRLLMGKEAKVKEVSAEKPGISLTRAINKPVKKAAENLRQRIDEVDKTLARLDKMSEHLKTGKETDVNSDKEHKNISLLGKLSQKNEEAKKNNSDKQVGKEIEKSTKKGIE